jgi:DNA polymerase II small subunit/DNA polymerase delta subunit B
MSFFGDIEMPKKNRIKLKMDYIDIHLTSQEFKMKEFQSMLQLMKVFGEETEEVEEIVSNPLYKFLHNTE